MAIAEADRLGWAEAIITLAFPCLRITQIVRLAKYRRMFCGRICVP